MPVDIVSIDFLDADFSTIATGTDFLNGSIGDKVTAEIIFDVHWESANTSMLINNGTKQIFRNDGGSFISEGFKVGDLVEVVGANNANIDIVLSSVSASKVEYVAPVLTSVTEDTILYGKTPIQNLDFYYGLTPNSSSSSYNSLLDGTPQKYKSPTINVTNTTPQALVPNTTSKSWVYDDTVNNSTIEGDGALVGINQQRFKIVHEFYIQPVVLDGQVINDSISAANVPYFYNAQSLRYDLKIDARYTTSGTNVDKSTTNGNIAQFTKSGDVAWFDENGNGNPPEYTLNSISYKNTFTTANSTAILPNAETDVSIFLASANSRFDSGSEFVVHVYRVADADDYQNTTTDLKTNFLVSRVVLTEGVPSVSQEGFINAGALATNLGGSEALIEFTFSPTFFTSQDDVLNDLQAFNQNPRDTADGYIIFVTCQDKTITNKVDSDKVAVLCDINRAAGIDLDDFYNTTGVFETQVLLNDHPTSDVLLAYTDYKGWLEDLILARATLQILKTNQNQGIGGNTIQNVWNFNKLTVKIEAQHKTDPNRFFSLEEKSFTSDTTYSRNYILPTGDVQNQVVWEEDTGAETGTHKYYNLTYPFRLRWEDWKVLFGADIDFTQPTKDWVQYINSDWEIKFNLYTEIDVVQDLGLPLCSTSLIIKSDDVRLEIATIGSTPTWTDALFGEVQTTNAFDYTTAYEAVRTINIELEDCADITQFRSLDNAKIQGVLNLSAFTNLDTIRVENESEMTGIILPASSGSSIRIIGNNAMTSADLSGFTNTANNLVFSQNANCTSVTLPTLPAGSGLFQFIGFSNKLQTLDITPILPYFPLAGAIINIRYNNLPVSEVNQVLIDLDASGLLSGQLDIRQTPAATPTGAGATAKANLISNGWTVTSD